MNTLDSLSIPDFGALKVAVTGGCAILLAGSIAMKDPDVAHPVFPGLHEVACGLRTRARSRRIALAS
jgi:hypothetical protein